MQTPQADVKHPLVNVNTSRILKSIIASSGLNSLFHFHLYVKLYSNTETKMH